MNARCHRAWFVVALSCLVASSASAQELRCETADGWTVDPEVGLAELPSIEEDTTEETLLVRGIEVSSDLGPIDVAQIAASGVRFVWVRALDGTRTDESFASTWDAAAQAFLVRGAFQELDASLDGAAQAEALLAHVGDATPGDLPLALSIESASSAASAWVETVSTQTGRLPVVIGSRATLDALTASGASFVAHATDGADCTSRSPFRRTSASAVPGIAQRGARVDLFLGTGDDLAILAGGYPGAEEGEALGEGAGGGSDPVSYRYPIDGTTRVARGASGWKYFGHNICGRQRAFNCDNNRSWFHNGIDFAAPLSTPVHASARGTFAGAVTGCPDRGQTSCGGNLGNRVQIRHADGTQTWYGHLRAGSIRVSSASGPIGCGTVVGLVGRTGNAQGPGAVETHVHEMFRTPGGANSDPFGNPTAVRSGACTCAPAPRSASRMVSSCTTATTTDDSDRTAISYPGAIPGAVGNRVTQTATLSNTGTTTWIAGRYSLRHVSGPALDGPTSIAIARDVAPRGSQSFSITVTVPTVPAGTTQSTYYQLVNAAGATFGARILVRFTGARVTATTCESTTLGRPVADGSYVQRGPEGCEWFRCTGGMWTAATEAAALSAGNTAYPNAMCGRSCEVDRGPGESTTVENGNGVQLLAPSCEWRQCVNGTLQPRPWRTSDEAAMALPDGIVYPSASCGGGDSCEVDRGPGESTTVENGNGVQLLAPSCEWRQCVNGTLQPRPWRTSDEAAMALPDGIVYPSASCGGGGSCEVDRGPGESTTIENGNGVQMLAPDCGWRQCVNGTLQLRPWTTSDEAAMALPDGIVYPSASCVTADPCTSLSATCGDCTARAGCGFCATDGQCHSETFETSCTDWRAAWFECTECDAITSCGECAVSGCGWCASSNQCMTARSGGLPLRPCADWHYVDTLDWCAAHP